MATAYRSSTSTNTGAAAASSIVVSIPAGIQYHDVLIATIAHDGTATSTISTPSGWTLLRNGANTTAALRMCSYWRLVDGTEPANYTWNFDVARQASGCIVAYSGASILVPGSNNGNSTTVASTTLSGTGTNQTWESGLALQFFCSRNTTSASTQTAGAGYTKREDTCTTASVFVGLAAQYQLKGLTIGGTSANNNTCSVASTSLCFAIYLEDLRTPFSYVVPDSYAEGSITASATNMTFSYTMTNFTNQSLVCFVSINKDVATVSSIATVGLTWNFVSRANTNAGSVEIWRSFAATPLAPINTTVTFSGAVVSANTMICAFVGADPTSGNGSSAIGAIASGTFTGSAPSLAITTTRNNSWIWAVANSSNTSSTVTVGANQTDIRPQVDGTNNTECWMWRQTNRTSTTGTVVTMSATSPAAGTGNILAVEILPALIYNLSALGAG